MSPTVDSAGYYAGWITGTFMIGRTCTGLLWGMASDRYGRRPCLLITMFNVALFGLLLGFSTSFTMAVLLRLAIGLGNGFMGVAKTCISEICSKEHELKAFGMLNGIWGLGLIVGPAVGGLLSRPAIQYPGYFTQDSIWRKFPYLMPCAVCSSIAVVGFFSIFFWLPETAGMNFVEKEVNITTSSLNSKNSKKYFNFKNKNKKIMDRSSVAFSPLNGNDKDKNIFSIEGEYINKYIYICIYRCMFICIYMYIYMCICICIYIYMYIYIHIYTNIHICSYMHEIGDSDDEEGDIENGEKGHFHDGGEFDSSEDTTLEVYFVFMKIFIYIQIPQYVYLYICVCSSYIHILYINIYLYAYL
jgi:MFS family permease